MIFNTRKKEEVSSIHYAASMAAKWHLQLASKRPTGEKQIDHEETFDLLRNEETFDILRNEYSRNALIAYGR